jgi:hypothetical protein
MNPNTKYRQYPMKYGSIGRKRPEACDKIAGGGNRRLSIKKQPKPHRGDTK